MLSSSVRRAGRLARSRTGSPWHSIQLPRLEPRSSRHFTRNSQLLLISRPGVRPQLPYLYATSRRSTRFQQQIAAFFSADTRKTIKETVIGALWYNVYGWTILALITLAWVGWRHETQEAQTPTPPEWSFLSRFWFREAKEKQFPEQLRGFEQPDWVHVAQNMKKTIDRLEDPNIDGAGIKSALGEGEGAILVEGVGKTGADITGKPEPWRRGYFQALMTAGLAAEHLEGFVKDTTKAGQVYAPEFVIGPSNPNPSPMPFVGGAVEEAPKEENCDLFFDPPQVFYMKVLTTTGFSTDQRMQAAVAYADWLSFKGLSSSAREMYDWAFDIASEAYAKRGEVPPVDKHSGMLQAGGVPVSSNLLTVATSLACHFAQSEDLTSALPAFLSILQVQRQLPPRIIRTELPEAEQKSNWGVLSAIIKEAPYPSAPVSGDEPATKTIDSACDEAGTLTHIGEVLYVLPESSLPRSLAPSSRSKSNNAVEPSSAQEAGLTWTRQAVDLAEESLEELCGRNKAQIILPGEKAPKPGAQSKAFGVSDRELREAKLACSTCLEMALMNWEQMVDKFSERERNIMVARAKAAKAQALDSELGAAASAEQPKASSSWFGLWKSSEKTQDPTGLQNKPVGKWTEEVQEIIRPRKMEVRQMLREEKLPMRRL